jgi:RNA polymerase sigma-70 factor (ECF subfamily)
MDTGPSYNTYGDTELLELLKNGDPKAFEMLYERHVDALYQFVQKRIHAKEDGKEIVQNVFEWLWTHRERLLVHGSVPSYFFGIAKHQTLNYIRSQKIHDRYIGYFTQDMTGRYDHTTQEMLNLADLESTIENSISKLPKKCQTVFRMSRMEHHSIQHIAERMNISTRTVENYISQALKHLRTNLGEIVIALILTKFL